MNADEVALRLGISKRAVYELAAPAGPLPCQRIGRRVTFEETDVMEFKAKCRCTEIKSTVVSSFNSAVVSTGSGSALESIFRARGLKPRLTPSTAKSRPGSTPSPKVSRLQSTPLRTLSPVT